MLKQTHFVIFKRKSRYSITECNNSGIRQAYMIGGSVTGDAEVLTHLSKMKPKDEAIESFIEKNAGRLLYAGC